MAPASAFVRSVPPVAAGQLDLCRVTVASNDHAVRAMVAAATNSGGDHYAARNERQRGVVVPRAMTWSPRPGVARVAVGDTLTAVAKPEQQVSSVTWATRMLFGEAAAVTAAALYLVYADLTTTGYNPQLALFITGYTAAYAVAFIAAAVALARRKRWSRGPALVLNLFLVPIGFFMVLGGLWWLGPILIGYGVVVAVLLSTRSTAAALGIKPPGER